MWVVIHRVGMVYIRAKKVKGIDYAYLVKSEWDENNKTSRQVTIKYLGKASDIEIEDIPESFRHDPKIVSFLSKHNPVDAHKKAVMIKSLRNKLFHCLCSANVDSALGLYKESRNTLSLQDFYDKVFRAVMYDIGSRWEKGKIDIATEHVCSNTAQSLIATIERMNQAPCTRKRIFLCCPDGELHHIASLVLESVLRSRGYRVINASPSIPTTTILQYIGDKDPDLIMVSVTLPDNIGAAKRLIRKISEEFNNNIPMIVGGSAFIDFKGDIPGVIAVCPPDNNSLEDVMRYVKSSLSTPAKNR